MTGVRNEALAKGVTLNGLPIRDRNQIKEAIRTKLMLRVSSQTPEWKTVPVVEELRVKCLVGEKMHRDRVGTVTVCHASTRLVALQGRTPLLSGIS